MSFADSYVDFDTVSKGGFLALATPVGTTEAFFLAIKFRSLNTFTNARIISIGASATTVFSLYVQANTSVWFRRKCATGEDTPGVAGFGANYGNDDQDHIAVMHVTSTSIKVYLDSLANVGGDSSMTGPLTEALTQLVINARVTGGVPDQVGKSRVYWVGLYSALPNADITSMMGGANPLTLGTLRSGDSFWALDGNANEYHGGTPFTLVGDPEFVGYAVPRKSGLRFQLSSPLINSLTSSLVSR